MTLLELARAIRGFPFWYMAMLCPLRWMHALPMKWITWAGEYEGFLNKRDADRGEQI